MCLYCLFLLLEVAIADCACVLVSNLIFEIRNNTNGYLINICNAHITVRYHRKNQQKAQRQGKRTQLHEIINDKQGEGCGAMKAHICHSRRPLQECHFKCQLLHFQSRLLLMHVERQWRIPKYLSPYHPCERRGWSFWFLALVKPTCGCYSNLLSEPEDCRVSC